MEPSRKVRRERESVAARGRWPWFAPKREARRSGSDGQAGREGRRPVSSKHVG